MSRSIHTTKRDLIRERKLAARDGIPESDSMTPLEKDDIQKSLYKVNAHWKHQAKKQDAPDYAELVLVEDHIVRRVRRRKTKHDA